jgi:hypothetical protein
VRAAFSTAEQQLPPDEEDEALLDDLEALLAMGVGGEFEQQEAREILAHLRPVKEKRT